MTPNTCTTCRKPIPRGEHYVAIDRHIERQGRLRAVTVKEAELLAAYHMACAPNAREDASVLMRFLTLGGATVTVTERPDRSPWIYQSRCTGCDWVDESSHVDKANEHAGQCRAMPKPGVS